MASSEEIAILIKAQNQTTAAFNAARQEISKLGAASQQSNQLLGGLTKGLGALGIAFSATAVIGFAKDILDTAGNIADLSSAIGISTDAVQDFKAAAEASGGTIDDVGRAIFNLNKGIGEGRGLAAALNAIGLEFDKIRAMAPEERFRAVTDALQSIEDPAQRAALGQQLLGKAYLELAPAIDAGIGKMRDANKMTEETIKTLDDWGDAIGRAATKAKNFGGEVLAKALNSGHDLWARMKQDIDDLGISLDKVIAKAPQLPAAFRGDGKIAPKTLSAEEAAQIEDALNKERKALDETGKAADTHAKKIKELQNAIFGRDTIAAANDYLQALGSVRNLWKVSADDQKKLNEATGKAIEVYERLGQTAPAAMLELFSRTQVMPALVDSVTLSIKDLGREVELTIPSLIEMPRALALTPEVLAQIHASAAIAIPEIPKQVKVATVSINDLARSITEMATIAGGSFGDVARGLGTIVSAANTAATSIKLMRDAGKEGGKLEGILSMTTGIMGIVSAALQAGKAIAALFDRNKGRDLVVDFAESFGGFDALHVKLQQLGDEGEQLWIKLTQGVGRNNPQQAQAAIDEVTAALDKQSKKQDDATQATEEGALATIETASQASEALDLVGEKLETNKGQWSDWSSSVMADIARVASSLGAVIVPSPSTPATAPGFAGGTHGAYLDFGVGTPVMLHGRERVMTEAEGRSGGGQPIVVQSIVQVDGREIARSNARYQRQVLAPYGVR